MATTNPKTTPKVTVPGIRVRSCSPRDTFHRGGIAFSRQATEHKVSDFTKVQLKAIRDEPMLVVEDIEIAAEPPAET